MAHFAYSLHPSSLDDALLLYSHCQSSLVLTPLAAVFLAVRAFVVVTLVVAALALVVDLLAVAFPVVPVVIVVIPVALTFPTTVTATQLVALSLQVR